MLSAHLLVLNYNGAGIMEETIPSLLEAARKASFPCQLSIIDNGSSDNSLDVLKNLFPQVPVWQRPNRVLCSYNDVAQEVSEDILIFLNNDLKVAGDFVDPLVGVFKENSNVFLVAPRVYDYDGRQETGGYCRAWMSLGVIKVDHATAPFSGIQATFAAGSAAAFDRRKFLELGGFDDLYLPGTMEDIDLCFRAWKKGYHCLYEPKSVVYHKGQLSFHRRYGRYKTAEFNARNVFLFMWKNLTDPWLWIQHVFLLPFRLLLHIVRGQFYWSTGFVKALFLITGVCKRRRVALRDVSSVNDREILSMRGAV